LGNLFTNFAPSVAEIKLLAPAELNNTGVNITQNPAEANVITALNGPMAHIYVKGANWSSNPDETRLGVVIDTLIRVLKLGENASDKVKKEFSNLYGSVDKILVRRKLNGPYEIATDVTEDASENVSIATESLDILAGTDYINAVERITGMNHPNRSGDIVLIMKDDMSDISQRFSTGVSCKSWHGGLNKSDSYVPFVIAYPGGSRYELNSVLNTLCADIECNGNWILSELIKEIVETQYSGQ